MDAMLGWTHISRAAVQRAEAQLKSDSQGVVDELGMLEVHQGYADRFFPGTSVLHTRLRYVLFVAWAYESLLHRHSTPRDVGRVIQEQEYRLVKTLKRNLSDEIWGLIGRRNEKPTQRPSMMYWSALGAWGLLHRRPDGSLPSRAEIHASLGSPDSHVELQDDEGRTLRRDGSPFIQLPPIPKSWPDGNAIDFYLSDGEREFIRECLSCVNQPGTEKLSLLARLAESRAGRRLDGHPSLLCKEVCDVAEDDWPALKRAYKAAGLAAITRGIYLALVEWRGIKDKLGSRSVSLDNLNVLISQYRESSLALSLEELALDVGFNPRSGVPQLLQTIQEWLRHIHSASSHAALETLLNPCLEQERKRKGNRARLAPQAVVLRREWWQDKARDGEEPPPPLHYRWHIAVNLLRDLEMVRPRDE